MSLNPKEEAVINLMKEDVAYENYVFKKVSETKWFYRFKEDGYFNAERALGPKPADNKGYFFIPEWNILPYLEKISSQVNQKGNEIYINELLGIIKNVTNYHIKNNKCLDNYRTWWYFIKILSNIPNEKINNDIIELIPIWLESQFELGLPARETLKRFLPKFLDSNKKEDLDKAEKIIDLITNIKWKAKYSGLRKEEIIKERTKILNKNQNEITEEEKIYLSFFNPNEEEPEFFIDKFDIFDFFLKDKITRKIGEKCSINVVFSLADKLKKIIKKEFKNNYDLSYIWLESFFYETEDILDIKELIALIIAEIILGKVKNNSNEINIIFEKFLSNRYQYPIFKRIVFFIISSEWEKYRNLFWNLIDADKKGKYFNSQYYEPEIYGILEKNIDKFSQEEKEKLKRIIEEKVPNRPHRDKKYRNYYKAHRKQKWYSAVKKDPMFTKLYDAQRSITNEEEEISFKQSTIRVGPGPSALNKEEILKMPNEILAKYLKDFKTINHWKGPTIGGLADLIKIVVEENPEKLTDNLIPFLDSSFLYVYEILWGLEDAWRNGRLINWKEIFSFISKYVSTQNFWDDKYTAEGDDWNVNHLWVIGIFGNLIKSGVHDYSRPFSEKDFLFAKKIIFKLLDEIFVKEKAEIQKSKNTKKNFIEYSLNSSLGKLIEGLIQLTFRMHNYEIKSGKVFEEKWKEEIIRKYDEILKNCILEGYLWLGVYLPDFYYYIDPQWVTNKISEINNTRELRWKAFIEGYLFSGRVSKELYKLMERNYLKSIDIDFEEKSITKHLVQHICFEYLNNDFIIDEKKNLINKILDKWNKIQIEEIISYFWRQRDLLVNRKNPQKDLEMEEFKKMKEKIIFFWKWVYENKFKEKQFSKFGPNDKEIISDLARLTIFLPEINSENLNWLELSAQYIHAGFNSPYFIEYLNFLKDKKDSVKYIGTIFLKILENYTPDYNEEHIRSIVEYLYEKKYKEDANEICDKYAKQGFEFLRDIYEKYRNN